MPRESFHSNVRRPDGLAFYCRDCAAQRSETSRRKRGVQPRKRSAEPVPVGSQWCPDCDTIKPLIDFARTTAKASGYHSYCLTCHTARGVESKIRLNGGTREYHLRRRYGIGQADFDEMLWRQFGRCAICRAPDPQHVDHDHRTGAVRGILCFNCNGGLGQFRDNQDYLAGAIEYLKGTTWQRTLIHPGVYRITSSMRERPPSRSS
ncbi:endonuclease VII domain-containing protein [Actinoplanes sp. M2I2]|uniref:endonuclease VII domain-containing protein n=1 Tax=Actinoplanes sp. M2I2 TaxID=1734444 RepID=UPI0020226B13|nr:endonuclease VII domain-containing protein [Actinoplanes sp. M2I2]